MVQRIVDLALVVLLAIGLWNLWGSASERSELSREQIRLQKKVGALPIKNPQKCYFQAIETGEPLHFAWRVYIPANHQFSYRTKTRAAGGGNSSAYADMTMRFRIRRVNDKVEVFVIYFHSDSDFVQYGRSQELAAFLSDHADQLEQLRVEQLGVGEAVELDLDRCYTLVKVFRPTGPTTNDDALEWIRFGPTSVVGEESTKDPLPPE